jgi:hypothetical protein
MTEDIDNPNIIRPHIVFTVGRLQRHPNHNTTIYHVYCVGVLWLGLLLLWSVNKHNMWSHYDWVVVVFVSNHNMWTYYEWVVVHIVFTVGRLQRHPNHNTTIYHVYWRTTTTINPIIIRPHIVFTDRRQQRQPYSHYDWVVVVFVSNHNMWTYYEWVVVVAVCQ